MPLISCNSLAFVMVFILAVYFKAQSFTIQWANGVLSWLINIYLLWKYPITSCDGVPIPTCPYRWPDGQGDVAKFLEGEKNSDAWSKKHGRVYRIWCGMNPEIVLTEPEDVKAVFKDSDVHLKGIDNDAGWLMGQLLGKCMGLVSGFEWRNVRASTGDNFGHKIAGTNVSRIAELTSTFFKELHDTGRLSQETLNPASNLRLLPFWVIADYIYGALTTAMRAELEDLIPLRESLFSRVIRGGLTRYTWSQYLPTSTNRNLHEFKVRWQIFNEKAFEACILTSEDVPIVQMYNSFLGGAISHDHVLQTLDEMLFGNLDVTIGGLSWIPLFLAANPVVQSQLREEMREAKITDEGLDKYLLRSDTLLAASVLESARLKPVAAFTIPQSIPTSRVVGGFHIPAGTNFVVDTHALNIRNSYWGKDSTLYRPERFLNRRPQEMRYHYWRFGFGPRQCLGKFVADSILRVVVAHLIENYQLDFSSKSHWDRNFSIWIAQPTAEISCKQIR